MTSLATGRPVVVPRRLPADVRRRRRLRSVADHSVAIALSMMFLLPFVFVVSTALMHRAQVGTGRLVPSPIDWHNFASVVTDIPFLRYLGNTVVYAGLSTVGVVVSSVPVAYALARLRFRGRNVLFVVLLATMMLPDQVTSVPLYIVYTRLHWIGSLKPLIVPSYFGDAFSIFLLRQFFLTIPQELSEAARVDGAGELSILARVVVPLAKPAIAAVALFNFLYAWNDFYNPLIYTGNSTRSQTLAVALSQFTALNKGNEYELQMAASLLFTLPVIVLFFFAQKVFVEGVTLTGVKG